MAIKRAFESRGGRGGRWALTPEAFASLVQAFGLPLAILIAVLWTGSCEVWVWGKTYRRLLEDRDFWRDQALKSTDLAGTATDVAAGRRPRRGAGRG